MDAGSVLAVIPARGGSKSIPRKNLQPLGAHPLLAYSIAAALQSKYVNRVLVSTDDEEIARVAREYGAETPFLRPAELARDDSPDLPVFHHALEWFQSHEAYQPEILVHLRPTSPLRPPDCVDRGIQALLSHPDADSVRAVTRSGQNPYKMWRISDAGWLVPLLRDAGEEAYNTPRQLLPATFWQTGHIDVIRTRTILDQASMTGKAVIPLLLDPAYAVDIDSPGDLDRARGILLQGDLPVVRPASSTWSRSAEGPDPEPTKDEGS